MRVPTEEAVITNQRLSLPAAVLTVLFIPMNCERKDIDDQLLCWSGVIAMKSMFMFLTTTMPGFCNPMEAIM